MLEVFFEQIKKISLRKLIFILPFIALFHELEEWNILSWHRMYNTNVPTEVTDFDLRIIFIFIIVIIFIWSMISLIPKNNLKATAYIILPAITFSLVNSFEHLFWMIEFQVYAPGVIFGTFLEAPLIILILYKILKEKLITNRFITIYTVFFVFGIINIIILGKELDPIIASAMKLGKFFADSILR